MTNHATKPDRRIVMATGNAGKVREFRAILGGHGWELLTPAEAGVDIPPVVETGRSYVENAISKAVAIARASGLPAIADDSGIEVDALDCEPGVTSARYGGPSMRNDLDRNALILRRLEGVPAPRRTARFRAVVALVVPGDRVFTRDGVVEGRVALTPRPHTVLRPVSGLLPYPLHPVCCGYHPPNQGTLSPLYRWEGG